MLAVPTFLRIANPSDILYVQARAPSSRDLAYNFYLNNYVGTDISILSSTSSNGSPSRMGLAEEPFKTVWVVRTMDSFSLFAS